MASSFVNLFGIIIFITLTSTTPKLSMCYRMTEERLKSYRRLDLPNASGPESLAFDCHGAGPYTGISDGRILKWEGVQLGWTNFAVTSPNRKKETCDGSIDEKKEEMCGRPLGLHFNTKTCDLYIADAYYGLLKVGPEGGLAKRLATSAQGVPFRLTNNLDIDASSGIVYFTDSSTVYQRWEYIMSFMNGDQTGRLLKYDIKRKRVTVLLQNLPFANGVALSKDNTFLIMSQTSRSNILKYYLKGPRAGESHIFSQFDGFPDNIERTENGDFWVALDNGEGSFGKKRLRPLREGSSSSGVVAAAVKVDVHGRVLEVLNEKTGSMVMKSVSDVREHNESLWIGSLAMPCVGLFMP